MRHRVAKKKLGTDKDHRKALMRNLAASLIKTGKINTTLAKAKFVRPFVEKLITKSRKADNFSVLKFLRSNLNDEIALRILATDLSKRFEGVPGGYTRIVKLGYRDGDNAAMARIEFTKEATKTKEPKKEVKSKVAKKQVKESKDA